MRSAIAVCASGDAPPTVVDHAAWPAIAGKRIEQNGFEAALGAAKVTCVAAVPAGRDRHFIVVGDNAGRVHVACPDWRDASDAASHMHVASVALLRGDVRRVACSPAEASGMAPPSTIAVCGPSPVAAAVDLRAVMSRQRMAASTGAGNTRNNKRGKHGRAREAAKDAAEAPEATSSPSTVLSASDLVRHLHGHRLCIADVAVQRLRRLMVVTASFDASVRVFDAHSGTCCITVPLPDERPALSLGFDASRLHPEIFVVGAVGGIFKIDLNEAARPGYRRRDDDADVDRPAGNAPGFPRAGVLALEAGADTEQHWFLDATFDASSSEATATLFNADGSDAGRSLMWSPVASLVTPTDCEARPLGSRTRVTGPVNAGITIAPVQRDDTGMPAAFALAASSGLTTAVAAPEEPAEPEAPAEPIDEFADDEDVVALRKERDELRAMCAELMQRRKALRAEMKVSR